MNNDCANPGHFKYDVGGEGFNFDGLIPIEGTNGSRKGIVSIETDYTAIGNIGAGLGSHLHDSRSSQYCQGKTGKTAGCCHPAKAGG